MKSDIYEQIKMLRDASIVRRSHTLRILRERTVAEHSHGICITLLQLYGAYKKMPSANLLAAACCHDLSEIETGDVPANVKWKYPELKRVLHSITDHFEKAHGLRYSLNEEEAKALAWADALDFGLFALEEITSGNRHLEVPAARIFHRITDERIPTVDGDVVKAYLITQAFRDEIRDNVPHSALKNCEV